MEKFLTFYTAQEREDIVNAIQAAEAKTSGEIRLHMENHCDHRPEDRAAYVFQRLDMHKTKERNGVLFYLSVCDHEFAVIGDVGIHQKVGSQYWEELCDDLEREFKARDYKHGMVHAIQRVGEALKTHFPWSERDKNELDDEISMGKL